MEHLAYPNFTLSDFFESLLDGIKKEKELDEQTYKLPDLFRHAYPEFLDSEKEFIKLSEENNLANYSPKNLNEYLLDSKDMKYLYENRFLKKGRSYYDALLAATTNNLCPYCGKRDVSELDHYLPKSKFPEFAITPINLVPSCHECNHTKLDDKNSCDLLNPYFDEVNTVQWLYCRIKIDEGNYLIPEYYLEFPKEFNKTLSVKIQRHFKLLKLFSSYSMWANQLIYPFLHKWREIYIFAGRDALISELECNENSYAQRELYINSFERALYQGLINLFSKSDSEKIFDKI